MVEITIYDLVGRKLVELVNEQKEPGYYNVQWDASYYSSGIYFINLKSLSGSNPKKIILMK